MSSDQLSFADIVNSLLPISSNISTSESTEFASSNAIAELIRKRRNRLEREKNAKNDIKNPRFKSETSADNENCSPPKLFKMEEARTTINDSLSVELSNSDSLSPLSLISNLSSSSWSQSSSLSATAFTSPSSSSLYLIPTSDSVSTSSLSSFSPPPPTLTSQIIIPQKSIGDEFATVCGRLSLLNSQKYVITIGEMARRIFGKEEFNYSLLGGLLRRAKTPNCVNQLKAELEAAGIRIERGRRRSSRLTLFGGLLEGEAVQFGKDFEHLTTTLFPSQNIAHFLSEATKTEKENERFEKIEKLKAARIFANEFLAVLNQDASPILDSYPLPTLPSEIQAPLTNFSIMTHDFGMFAIKTTMEMYCRTLDAQILALS